MTSETLALGRLCNGSLLFVLNPLVLLKTPLSYKPRRIITWEMSVDLREQKWGYTMGTKSVENYLKYSVFKVNSLGKLKSGR